MVFSLEASVFRPCRLPASLTGVIAQGPAIGSGAAANAILMVFYLFNRDAPIMLFPIPIQIRVKWIVLFVAAIETAYLLLSHFSLSICNAPGTRRRIYLVPGIFTRRRVGPSISEWYFGLRNSYYR